MKAMIFAAGLGTRLKPLTDTIPKALIPVCGKPLLWHVMSKLSAAGYDDFVVNVHHHPDAIIEYLATPEISSLGKISVSDERDLLRETGGAVSYARELLKGSGNFLIHNVDILSNLDLSWFRSNLRPEAISTILVSQRKTQRYLLFDDDLRLCGWTNIATGEIKSPYGKIDPSKYRMLAFAGIHYMSEAIFNAFDKEKAGDRFPIIDFYVSVCDRYPIYGVCPENLQLIDVGKIDTLSQAEAYVKALRQE